MQFSDSFSETNKSKVQAMYFHIWLPIRQATRFTSFSLVSLTLSFVFALDFFGMQNFSYL